VRTRTALELRSLPIWRRLLVWSLAMLSPTGYGLAVICLCRLQVPTPPAWFVIALSCVIPVAALIFCWLVVWLSHLGRGSRVGWLVLTTLAMAAQVGLLLVVLASAITAAISLP